MKYILLFFIGSIFASFSLCISFRIIHHEDFILERSHCENCGHTLSFFDLTPVISFIVLKGKCRYCHHKLNKSLFITEVAGGILLVTLYPRYSYLSLILYLTVLIILFIMSYIDFYTHYVYDCFIFLLIAIDLFNIIFIHSNWNDLIVGSLIISLPLFILYMINHDFIGLGDISIFFTLGLLMGTGKVIILFIGCIYSSLIASLYLILFKKYSKKDSIAFVPFILAGYILCLYL